MERLARGVGYLFSGGDAHQLNTDRLQEVAQEMGVLEKKLAEASRPNRALLASGPFFHVDADRPKTMKLGVFVAKVGSKRSPKKMINWVRLLAVIRNVTLSAVVPAKNFIKTTTIKYESSSQFETLVTVDNLPYFQRLTSLIEASASDELLVNYLRWAAIHRYHHLVGGPLRAIFAGYGAEAAGAPVVKRCTDLVATVYPWTVTRRYVAAFAGRPVRQAAQRLVDEVSGKFRELLLQPDKEAVAWLPKKGAEEAAKRLAALKTTIAAPRWLLDVASGVEEEDFAVDVGEATYAGFDLEELFGRIVARSLDRMLLLVEGEWRGKASEVEEVAFTTDGPVFSTELRYDPLENHLSKFLCFVYVLCSMFSDRHFLTFCSHTLQPPAAALLQRLHQGSTCESGHSGLPGRRPAHHRPPASLVERDALCGGGGGQRSLRLLQQGPGRRPSADGKFFFVRRLKREVSKSSSLLRSTCPSPRWARPWPPIAPSAWWTSSGALGITPGQAQPTTASTPSTSPSPRAGAPRWAASGARWRGSR